VWKLPQVIQAESRDSFRSLAKAPQYAGLQATAFARLYNVSACCLAGLLVLSPAPVAASPVQVIECNIFMPRSPLPIDSLDPRFTIRRHIEQTEPFEEISTEFWAQGKFQANGTYEVTVYPFEGNPRIEKSTSIRTTILDGYGIVGDEYLDEALSMEKTIQYEGYTLDSMFISLKKADGTAIDDHRVVPDQIDQSAWDPWPGFSPECVVVWRAPGDGIPCVTTGGGSGLCLTGSYLGRITSITLEPHAADHDDLFTINAGLNDAWVSTDAALQGVFLTVFEDQGLLFLSWFTFDSVPPDESDGAVFGAADQRWVSGVGSYSGNTVTMSVELTSGGIFNASEPHATQAPGYGTITIVFKSCTEAVLNYAFPSADLVGEMALTRAVPDNVALCEALSAQ